MPATHYLTREALAWPNTKQGVKADFLEKPWFNRPASGVRRRRAPATTLLFASGGDGRVLFRHAQGPGVSMSHLPSRVPGPGGAVNSRVPASQVPPGRRQPGGERRLCTLHVPTWRGPRARPAQAPCLQWGVGGRTGRKARRRSLLLFLRNALKGRRTM